MSRMQTSPKGIDLLHSFEGLRLDAYPDPGTGGAPWTIGWGATTDLAGRSIKPGTKWTRAQADERFAAHLATFEGEVNRLLAGAPVTQGQFDGLVSFCYNCGPANLAKSTLLKLHNAGDYAGAADQFGRWNKAAGKVLRGLTRRRAAEADLYRGAE
jgi:GH24 family phage-related lysozyme (muramidase)